MARGLRGRRCGQLRQGAHEVEQALRGHLGRQGGRRGARQRVAPGEVASEGGLEREAIGLDSLFERGDASQKVSLLGVNVCLHAFEQLVER